MAFLKSLCTPPQPLEELAKMADDVAETNQKPTKLLKTDNDENSKSEPSVHQTPLSFSNFQMTRVLNVNSTKKQIFVEGTFKGYESPAVVILEKKIFPEDELFLKRGFFNEGTIVRKNFNNDCYGAYECFPTREHNGLNAQIIHPATQKHIDKFERKDLYIVEETYDSYKNITLPYIESSNFSLQWVDNILAGKAEAESIIYNNKDEENGFVMLPDIKWDGNMETLYIMVLARKRIKSLRELNASHLPMLKNIRDTCKDVIKKKFNIEASQLRMYLHYQPSYYHLHVHVTYLMFEAPGIWVEKAHLLNTVISNIEMMPDYYQKASLSFVLKEDDPLLKKYHEKGIVAVINGSMNKEKVLLN